MALKGVEGTWKNPKLGGGGTGSYELVILLWKSARIGCVSVGASSHQAAAVALSSLIHALDELDMVAIVRYAYDRRANPQVGVAFPHIKDTYEVIPTGLLLMFFFFPLCPLF